MRQFGLQLYTLREQLAHEIEGTLAGVAAAGYSFLEPMSVSQLVAIQPAAKALGLPLPSCHYSSLAVTGNYELLSAIDPAAIPQRSFTEMIDIAAAAGVEYLVLGYLHPAERTTLDDYRLRANQLNRAAEQVAAAGLQHVYHHHSFEFTPLNKHGTSGWDILRERLDHQLTQLEADVFWLQQAGLDPVQFLEQHGSWLSLLHLKDSPAVASVEYDELALPPESFLPVGSGTIDIPRVLAKAREIGIQRYIVEQDHSAAAMQDIRLSARHLQTFLD